MGINIQDLDRKIINSIKSGPELMNKGYLPAPGSDGFEPAPALTDGHEVCLLSHEIEGIPYYRSSLKTQ